jgi:hypothetical protein
MGGRDGAFVALNVAAVGLVGLECTKDSIVILEPSETSLTPVESPGGFFLYYQACQTTATFDAAMRLPFPVRVFLSI